MPVMYVLCGFDYDDAWYELIAASTDRELLQDICLSLFQEQDFETWFDTVHYYDLDPEFIEPLRPIDCNYFIKEVPLCGCQELSKNETNLRAF